MNIFRLSRPLLGRVFLSPLVSRLCTMRPHSLSEGVSGLRPYLHSKHIPRLSECALWNTRLQRSWHSLALHHSFRSHIIQNTWSSSNQQHHNRTASSSCCYRALTEFYQWRIIYIVYSYIKLVASLLWSDSVVWEFRFVNQNTWACIWRTVFVIVILYLELLVSVFT